MNENSANGIAPLAATKELCSKMHVMRFTLMSQTGGKSLALRRRL